MIIICMGTSLRWCVLSMHSVEGCMMMKTHTHTQKAPMELLVCCKYKKDTHTHTHIHDNCKPMARARHCEMYTHPLI